MVSLGFHAISGRVLSSTGLMPSMLATDSSSSLRLLVKLLVVGGVVGSSVVVGYVVVVVEGEVVPAGWVFAVPVEYLLPSVDEYLEDSVVVGRGFVGVGVNHRSSRSAVLPADVLEERLISFSRRVYLLLICFFLFFFARLLCFCWLLPYRI